MEKVNHPSHYGGDSVYEVIKVAEVLGLDEDAYLFNALKYIARAGKKSGEEELDDLLKAQFYLNRRIDKLTGAIPNWEQHFGTKGDKKKAS